MKSSCEPRGSESRGIVQTETSGKYLPRISAALITLLPPIALGDLTQVNGMNEAERNTATMIQALCPQMVLLNNQTPLVGGQAQLLVECRALVQTSNAQQGSGLTNNDLGYDEPELREALSQIAHQEVAIESSTATETIDGQFDTISTRMSALRRGAIGGGPGGLSLNMDGQHMLANVMTGGAAGDGASGWSLYLNGNYNFGDKETTSRESGFDYDNYGVTFGADRRLSAATIFGAAVGYATTESEVVDNGGTFEDENQSLSAYATHTYANGIYIDAIVTYGMVDYDTLRKVRLPDPSNPVAGVLTDDDIKGSTEGEQTAFSLGIGKDFHSASNNLDYGVYGRAQAYRSRIDGYSETSSTGSGLELEVKEQVINSAEMTLGAQISRSLSRSYGVLVPQARVEYFHEFENDSRGITARYIHDPFNNGAYLFSVPTDNPDRDFFTVGLGVSAVLQSGTQMFAFYETTAGLDDMTNHSVIFGVRGEF